jgi:hypothetical protein
MTQHHDRALVRRGIAGDHGVWGPSPGRRDKSYGWEIEERDA